MATWHEHVRRTGTVPEWPYAVRYGEDEIFSTDVLVLGGGIGGAHAAINARRSGARVLVLEKGAAKWSGNGGAGVDHWLSACTNPCSEVTPEDFTTLTLADCGGYDCGPLRYVHAREAYDALLDCESMGMRVRDVTGEFRGAAFRDDETGLMFAYDYRSRIDLRVQGWNVKPCLNKEMLRAGVEVRDRVMVSSLLVEDGPKGRRVTGATGLDTRTGAFVVVTAKATILATGLPGRLWVHSTEYRSTFRDPNCTGDGLAAAWTAGAELVDLDSSAGDGASMAYIAYGVGNAHNTWHGCPIVDSNGTEVPWVDRDGKVLASSEQRFLPSPGQRFMVGSGLRIPPSYDNHVKQLAPDLPERIRRGEIALPLYADLTRLPPLERRAIFGLMVGNEGRTRVPVYQTLTRAGFDPDVDLLQVPVMDPDAYGHASFWAGMPVPHWRQWGTGGLTVDWDLRTSLDGLYAAGGSIYGAGAHSSAAASGRYAGRKAAAAAAKRAHEGAVDRGQVTREKARVYAPIERKGRAMGWKELNAGICKVMQDYCGRYRSQATLERGLSLLRGLRESEASTVYAANPHELARAVECLSLLTVGEAVMHASLARKASSALHDFTRLDYPAVDPPEWRVLLPVRLEDGKVRVGRLPLDWHLSPPNAPTYQENYALHSGLAGAGEEPEG